MKTNKSVKKYELACQNVLREFASKYYDYEPEDVEDCWVGNEVGGMAMINDEFYDINFMVKALRLNLYRDDMFGYYYYCLDSHLDDKNPIKLEAWIHLKDQKGFKEQLGSGELVSSPDNVEEFTKALNS